MTKKVEKDPEFLRVVKKADKKELIKLIEKGQWIDERGVHKKTALHIASEEGNLEITFLLLYYGANISNRDDYISTPLHLAAHGAHFTVLMLLLRYGADLSVQNSVGNSPLHQAVIGSHHKRFQYLGVLHALIEKGTDINLQNSMGETPLHLAAAAGLDFVVLFLLQRGADAFSSNLDGQTPLHYACLHEREIVVSLLLQFGADPHVKSSSGISCLDIAKTKTNLNIIQLLNDHLIGSTDQFVGAIAECEKILANFNQWRVKAVQAFEEELDVVKKKADKITQKKSSSSGGASISIISSPTNVVNTFCVDQSFNWFSNIGDVADQFEIVTQLGEGSQAKVYKAVHKTTQITVALKAVEMEDGKQRDDVKSEIDILSKLNHPNVVKYYGCYSASSHFNVIMEFCDYGTIVEIRKGLKVFSEIQIAGILFFVMQGLIYLHSHKIIHRDMKAQNILVSGRGLPKIADFGVSTQDTGSKSKEKSYVGTPFFMAPEIINGQDYSSASDIWATGITAIQLADGVPPYYRDMIPVAMAKIQNAEPPTFRKPEEHSENFRYFVSMCLQKTPQKREIPEILLTLPFLRPSHIQVTADCEKYYEPILLEMIEQYKAALEKREEERKARNSKPIERDLVDTKINSLPSKGASPDRGRSQTTPVQLPPIKDTEKVVPSSIPPGQSTPGRLLHPMKLLKRSPSNNAQKNIQQPTPLSPRSIAAQKGLAAQLQSNTPPNSISPSSSAPSTISSPSLTSPGVAFAPTVSSSSSAPAMSASSGSVSLSSSTSSLSSTGNLSLTSTGSPIGSSSAPSLTGAPDTIPALQNKPKLKPRANTSLKLRNNTERQSLPTEREFEMRWAEKREKERERAGSREKERERAGSRERVGSKEKERKEKKEREKREKDKEKEKKDKEKEKESEQDKDDRSNDFESSSTVAEDESAENGLDVGDLNAGETLLDIVSRLEQTIIAMNERLMATEGVVSNLSLQLEASEQKRMELEQKVQAQEEKILKLEKQTN